MARTPLFHEIRRALGLAQLSTHTPEPIDELVGRAAEQRGVWKAKAWVGSISPVNTARWRRRATWKADAKPAKRPRAGFCGHSASCPTHRGATPAAARLEQTLAPA